MCFWRDVTERQQLVEELEQRGRLIDLAHDAIIVREPVASTVTYWNREATQMYGYSAEEAKGRITHDLLATRFPESREAVDQPLLERGRWDGELSHLRADGRRILVSSRQALVRGTRDEALAVIELNADITESKRAEEELRAAEERFPRLIESAPDAMVIVNQDGVIELVLLHQLEQALVPRIRIGPRWRLAWRYHPAVRSMLLGGDFIGACERGDGSLALLIGDVAGHDTASRRRAPGRHSARRGWARPKATRRSSRSRCSFTASLTNQADHRASTMATACLAEVDAEARELRLIRAGHDAPLLITPGAVTGLNGDHGPALDLSKPHDWPLQRVPLPAEGAILLFTDGLTERRLTPASVRRFQELAPQLDAEKLLGHPPGEAIDGLLAQVFPGGTEQLDDDVAVILLNLGRTASPDVSAASDGPTA